MIGRMTAMAALGALLGSAAWAQDQRLRDQRQRRLDVQRRRQQRRRTVLGGDGELYDRIDPKDSFSWGLTIGYYFNENSELEFIYSQQQSTLEVSGTATREIGDFNIKTYHGVYSYNFGETDAVGAPLHLHRRGGHQLSRVDLHAHHRRDRRDRRQHTVLRDRRAGA